MKLLFVVIALFVGLAQAQRATQKAHDTSHLDKLDRDELLNILGEIENSAPSKSTSSPYRPPSSYSPYAPVTAPTAPPRSKYTTTYKPYYAPSTPKTSSDIDDLINKYKNKKGQPGSPTADDLLRRLRSSSPSPPLSTYNFPGPNYAAPGAKKTSSLPYPTSYDSKLYPSRPSSYPSGPSYPSAPYPSSPSSSYPRAPTYSSYPSVPSYPSAPSYASRPSYPTSYNTPYTPSGRYGDTASKYAVTTKKPKKGFFSKIFG